MFLSRENTHGTYHSLPHKGKDQVNNEL